MQDFLWLCIGQFGDERKCQVQQSVLIAKLTSDLTQRDKINNFVIFSFPVFWVSIYFKEGGTCYCNAMLLLCFSYHFVCYIEKRKATKVNTLFCSQELMN